MFDWKKPTAQMLGRIMIRDVGGIIGEDAGAGRTAAQDDNPFSYEYVVEEIEEGLHKAGFTRGTEYIIMKVPNIVDISYGRGVGYTFTEHDLGKDIHDISATKIRKQMREDGNL
jgi:hypothetical protein